MLGPNGTIEMVTKVALFYFGWCRFVNAWKSGVGRVGHGPMGLCGKPRRRQGKVSNTLGVT